MRVLRRKLDVFFEKPGRILGRRDGQPCDIRKDRFGDAALTIFQEPGRPICVDNVGTTLHMIAHRNQRERKLNMMATTIAHRDSDDADRRGVIINLRASARLKNLIDRAAALLGQNRTEFMLDSARLRAEDVLLDQKLFSLNEEQYRDFLNLLDEPPKPTEELRKLLSAKAPWEK